MAVVRFILTPFQSVTLWFEAFWLKNQPLYDSFLWLIFTGVSSMVGTHAAFNFFFKQSSEVRIIDILQRVIPVGKSANTRTTGFLNFVFSFYHGGI